MDNKGDVEGSDLHPKFPPSSNLQNNVKYA